MNQSIERPNGRGGNEKNGHVLKQKVGSGRNLLGLDKFDKEKKQEENHAHDVARYGQGHRGRGPLSEQVNQTDDPDLSDDSHGILALHYKYFIRLASIWI
jgi:hypothetical protein